jgi:hypothetical protein
MRYSIKNFIEDSLKIFSIKGETSRNHFRKNYSWTPDITLCAISWPKIISGATYPGDLHFVLSDELSK